MYREGVWNVGDIQLGSVTEATDPCYNRDVWCRINNIDTLPGKYQCFIFVKDKGEWGMRVARLRVCHESIDLEATDDDLCNEYIGEIGVDAGLAGFYNNKPDYNDEEWAEFCKFRGQYYIRPEGVCSLSGYGDGGYAVYGRIAPDGKCYDALEIIFIDDDEDEEYDAEYDEEYEED